MKKQVYDAAGNKIPGLFKSGDALIVSDNSALLKAKAEKEKLQRIDTLETKVDSITNDLTTIKTLLEKLVRDNNGTSTL